ncbi:protein of the cbbq norq nirq gvpn family [Vairimorpha apis BRL 01]|uniref:Midasin n=1 Tax=Vairimorpha apis BRL 01 TaxID=1037528 RepID=T0MJ44_9MICR|nr:protein of the cbbq norq nirq gvpn family [Vairimorpha apis BRL 01]
MSPDYDGYDLVGGYSTIDVNKMVNELFLELKVEKPKMCDNLTCLKILKKNVINVGDYIENKSSLNGVVGNNRGDIKNMINFGDSREKKTIIGNNNVGSTLNKNNTMSDNNLGGTLNRNNTMSDNNLGGTLNKNNTMSDNNLGDTLNKNNTMSDNNLGSTLNKNNTMSDNNLGGKLNKSNIVKDNKHILDKINLLEKCIKNKTQFIWKDGLLVQAMKEGQWILLDEINLCSTETLNMIEALLSKDTLINYESGNYSNDESNKCDIGIEYNKNDTTINKKHINRKINVDMVYTNKDTINNIHPNFMLFACMNPLGVGKKNFNTVQLNKVNFQDFTTNIHDIYKIVKSYNLDLDSEKLADAFYETKKKIYKRELTNKVEPILTGRTLIRALSSISTLTKERLYNIDGFNYSLYNDCGLSNNNVTTYYNNITTICKYCSIEDIISVFILSQFDLTSRSVVYSLFEDVNINKCDDKKCLTINNMNKHNNGISNMNICNGNEDSYNNNNIYSCSNININNSSFIITNKIKILLKDIVTAINLNMPVLLQGDTSTGKTSIIYYLSNIYNKKVIRINNHEQTESSDYIGTYISLESEENGCDLKKSKKCNLESKNEYNLENENGCDLDKAEGYNLESKNEYNLDNENGCDLKKYKKCNLESKNEYNLENENDYSKYKDNKEEHMNKSKKSKLNSNKDTNNTQIHTTDHVSTANNTITSSIPSNNIIFKESIFIKAVRNGWWVILDELNLAQSDVLEVLNRLLDDNREIYIPATNTLIKAHPDFRIFATQNIEYSGRKQMSKAFRNRFIEITFYEKDENELLEILHNKTRLPKRYCNYMIQVYSKLKNMRNYNNIVTLRDLFRWSRRLEGIISEEDVYEKGLSVIYERQRNEIDRNKVMDVFDNGYVRDRCRVNEKMDNVNDKINRINIVNEKINRMDNVYEKINRINIVNEKIDIMDNVYDKINRMDNINDKLDRMDNVNDELFAMQETSNNNKINTFIYTKSMKKLIKLIQTAIKYKEPILLIGETGIGKTRICELLAEQNNTKLNYLNMHSGTESSDFIGTYSITNGKIEYKPGPLINSMINGEYFLIDEINLAESATLERLNSLLEDKREIFVTETDSNIKAHDNFILFATMNPGNDFGKSELSPALRNRFTEIYFELSEEEIYEITINRISRFFTKGYYKKDMKNENECSVIGDVKNTKMNEEMHYTNKHTKSNDKLLTNAHKIDNVIHTTDHSTIDKDLNDNYTKKIIYIKIIYTIY